ncbi:hypothetical protein Hypma_009743 [Hypsizygus marmoreus]|uniref:Uncharacterized protein n=1 Tax=Hypsizygus marmoreus TaxID=39966 RepID=A0A369JNS9_HYPMA|nr:hypothetical protein Hypma_009743 [Hypsizygus marmoreus]
MSDLIPVKQVKSPFEFSTPANMASSADDNYHSSDAVRNALSRAYSTMLNPRSLEKVWHPAYGHSFHDLVRHHGELVVSYQWPLYIPGPHLQNIRLDAQLKKAESDQEKIERTIAALDQRDIGSDKIRKSQRLLEGEQSKLEEMKNATLDFLSSVVDQITKNNKARAKLDDREADGVSVHTMRSVHDKQALDYFPDYAVCHLLTAELASPMPDTHNERHALSRGGYKTYHECIFMLSELKPPPRRHLSQSKYDEGVIMIIRSAAQQLAEYCAAYFEVNPNAGSVIAIAAAGHHWSWVKVEKKQFPQWDWVRKAPKHKNQVSAFKKKFTRKHYILATTDSDQQLRKILQHFIARKDHPVAVPDALIPLLAQDESADGDE